MALRYSEDNLGEFQHVETKKWFSWSKNTYGIFNEYPFVVCVGPDAGQFRYARILKTVAYIVVDEDEFGRPVEEKWKIKHQWSKVDI